MSLQHVVRIAVLMTLAVTLLPAMVAAQEGTLSGVITDHTKSVLPGVTVTATDLDTGRQLAAVTDGRGQYRLAMPAGRYRIRADLPGFTPLELSELELLVGQNRTLSLSMGVATIQETVTVAGESPLVDTKSSQVAGNVDRRQMEALPISGRNWMELSMLVKGVTANDVDNNRPGVGRDDQFALVLDGQQITQTMVQTEVIGQPGLSREAVAEFQIVTNLFDVTQGRSTGVSVQAITRSGTNNVHGTLYGYFRDDRFNAADFVAGEVLPYSNQQVGGSVGGPVIQNRIHYFATYEFEREPNTIIAQPAPYGGQRLTFDSETKVHNFLGRADIQFGSKDHLMVRGSMWDSRNPFVNAPAYPTEGTKTRFDSQSVVGTWSRVVSEAVLQELRVGYAGYHWQFAPADGVPLTPAYSFPGLVVGARFNHPQEFWQDALSARYDLTLVKGRNTWKVGGEYIHQHDTGLWFQQARGTFFFSALPPDYLRRFPLDAWNDASRWDLSGLDPLVLRFDRFFGDFTIDLPRPILGLWLGDTWTVNNKLTVNFGVRYENDFGITAPPDVEASDIFTPGIRDHNNIAPRAGFNYNVTGESDLVIRGGAGLFYGTPVSEVGFDAQLFNGQRVLSNSFVNDRLAGFLQDPTRGVTIEDIQSGRVPIPPQNPFALSPDYELPYTWQSVVGFQKQLNAVMSVEADLTYWRGYDLGRGYDPNLFYDPVTGYNLHPNQHGRPNPGYTTIILRTSDGKSNYLGLSTALNRRYRDNFQGGATYTLMFFKNDDGGGSQGYGGSPDNMFCYLECEWARSTDFQRHTLRLNGIYRAPWGFTIAGAYFFGSGNYFSTVYSANPFGLTRNTNRYNPGPARAVPENVRDRFDGPDTIGAGEVVPRNALKGEPLHKVDVRVSKDVSLGGGVRLTGIAEVFNLFNHANFGRYNGQFNASTFGEPRQNLGNAYLPRVLQLAAKLSF